MERKATDILLELEEKINKILQYVVVIDSSYKLILSRLDKINSLTSVANPKPQIIPSNEILTSSVQITETSKVEELLPSTTEQFSEFKEEPKSLKVDKVRVSQVIRYPKEKNMKNSNVILALVKVYDSAGQHGGKILGETRTDQNGRWKLDLSPGQYFVHIVKPASAQKPQIDHYFDISVGDSKKTLELEPIG